MNIQYMMDFEILYTKNGLYLLVALFVGISFMMNAYIFSRNISGKRRNLSLLPPSYIIAIVWTILIGLMAYSQWLVMKIAKRSWKVWLIPLLFLYCVLYPFYTYGFSNKKIVDLANVFTILFSGFAAWSIYDITHTGSYFIFMTTLWSAFATYASL